MLTGSKLAINDAELLELKMVVDDNLDSYLDEIVLLFGIKTGKKYATALCGGMFLGSWIIV